MIHNYIISLSPGSPERTEAENILKYTLLLDIDVPFDSLPSLVRTPEENITSILRSNSSNYINNIDNIIKILTGVTAKNCSKLLVSISNIDLFFGSKTPHLIPGKTATDPLTSKHHILPSNFFDMICGDLIIWTYHAIVTELFSSERITTYHSVNTYKGTGINELLRKGKVSFNEENVTITKKKFKAAADDYQPNTTESSRKDNYEKSLNSKSKIIEWNLLKGNEIPLQFSQFCYLLGTNPSAKWIFSSKTTKYTFENVLPRINRVIRTFTPKINDRIKGTDEYVDKIYTYYIIERIFNINLFYNLLLNIDKHRNNYNNLLLSESLSVLKDCIDLPNVFSRNYFITSAFSYLDKETQSNIDFWHNVNIAQKDVIVGKISEPSGFHFAKWIRQYRAYIKYMSTFFFPLYRWYFLSIFLRYIENSFSNYSHFKHLEIAFNILSIWLKQHGDKLLYPANFEISCSFQEIAEDAEEEFAPFFNLFSDLQKDAFEILFPFCKSKNIELNALINRNYFKDKIELNDHLIRFYIDTLFRPI